jgi:hypothetical protein
MDAARQLLVIAAWVGLLPLLLYVGLPFALARAVGHWLGA